MGGVKRGRIDVGQELKNSCLNIWTDANRVLSLMYQKQNTMRKFDDNNQAEITLSLAIGRLFKLGSRPSQPGDIEQYENLKYAAFEAAEYLGLNTKTYQPNANIDLYKQFRD